MAALCTCFQSWGSVLPAPPCPVHRSWWLSSNPNDTYTVTFAPIEAEPAAADEQGPLRRRVGRALRRLADRLDH